MCMYMYMYFMRVQYVHMCVYSMYMYCIYIVHVNMQSPEHCLVIRRVDYSECYKRWRLCHCTMF